MVADPFDAARHPVATYRSEAVLWVAGRVGRRVFGLRLQVPGFGALVPSHLDLSIAVTAVRATRVPT